MAPTLVDCRALYGVHLAPTFRAMTVDEAQALKFGMLVPFRAADNLIRTCKVNGKPRRWVRRPGEVAVPVRYGARSYAMLKQVDIGGVVERLLVEERGIGGLGADQSSGLASAPLIA